MGRFRGAARALVATIGTLGVLVACAPALAAERGVETDMTWGLSATTQQQEAAAVHDLGARWVRLTFSWHDSEPQRGVYDPRYLDEVDSAVTLLSAQATHVLLVVDEAPSWETGSADKNTPPADDADFARFLTAMAARYRGRVAWEIWNEENTQRFWSTGVDAARYAALLKASYPAIKSVDPTAPVLFGGLSTNDYSFLEAAYRAVPSLGDYYDALATHPYNGNDSPDLTRRAADGRIASTSFDGYRELHATMLAHGDDKPIWLTEFGWATYPGGVDAATQARYVALAYACAAQDPYVPVAIYYELRNNSWAHDAPDWEDQLGLMTSDFAPKPAYAGFKAGAAPSCAYHDAGGAPAAAPSPPPPKTPPPPPATAPPDDPTGATAPPVAAHRPGRPQRLRLRGARHRRHHRRKRRTARRHHRRARFDRTPPAT